MSSVLSPIYEAEKDIRIGQSIRCRDCGAHLPWSRTHRHVCTKERKIPLGLEYQIKPTSKVSFAKGSEKSSKRRPSVQPTWHTRVKPAALDADKIAEFQQKEMDHLNAEQTFTSRISWAESSAASEGTGDSLLEGVPGGDEFAGDSLKPSWSWADRDFNLGRKYSMPAKKVQLDPSVLKAVHNRSASVPEITAAAKVAQERRRKNHNAGDDITNQKKLFQDLLEDIEKLIGGVDVKEKKEVEIPAATLHFSNIADSTLINKRNQIIEHETLSNASRTLERSKSISHPTRTTPSETSLASRPKRRPTIAAGFIYRDNTMPHTETTAAIREDPQTRKEILQQVDITQLTTAQHPELVRRAQPNASSTLRKKRAAIYNKCAGCNEPILISHDKHIEAAGNPYHVECFRCQVCNRLINYSEPFWQDVGRIRKDGSFEEGLIMCQEDYKWLIKTKLRRV